MESELENRLQDTQRDVLILLIQELVTRYPALHQELADLLERFTVSTIAPTVADDREDVDDEVTEDWDFSGEELSLLHALPHPVPPPVTLDVYRQRIENYERQLKQGESSQAILDDLTTIMEEIEMYVDLSDYATALNLYALILDKRLTKLGSELLQILDTIIDDWMPVLETLLREASSNIGPDGEVTLAPLLTTDMRQRWLQRLFQLWLVHIDIHHGAETVSELLLDTTWSEDVAFLHTLVQTELQQHTWNTNSNIVDFARQYRMRALEKFLKELP